MNWTKLVDRCTLMVDANKNLILNLLYEAEEELTRVCNVYEDEFIKTITVESDVLDLPEEVQDVVIEMCYQMGLTGFSKFKKTIAFLRLNKFREAATEMLDRRWYKQTPNRAKRLSDKVKYAK